MIYDSLANIERYHSIFDVPSMNYTTMGPTPFTHLFEAHSLHGTLICVREGSALVCTTYPEGMVNLSRDINGFVYLEATSITSTAVLDDQHFIYFAPYEPYSIIVEEHALIACELVEVK